MSLVPFLHDLFEHGRLVVDPDPEGLAADPVALGAVLREFDRSARLNAPGTAPAFLEEVAVWAARLLYQSAQFLVCRDLGEPHVRAAFRTPCPAPRGPATDYSADLMLSFLPQLIALARRLASGDPLVEELVKLAGEWPLSSVGVTELAPGPLDCFIEDPCLRQWYADRILERNDLGRIADPRVAAILRESLGARPELSPAIARALACSPA